MRKSLMEQLKEIRETDCGFDIEAGYLNEDDLARWEKLIFPFLERLAESLPEIAVQMGDALEDLENYTVEDYDIGPNSVVDHLQRALDGICGPDIRPTTGMVCAHGNTWNAGCSECER